MKKLLLIVALCLSSCSFNQEQPKEDTENTSTLVDLVESTHIIRALIKNDKLSDVLEDHDPEQLSVLLDNFSPAQMAFELEILATTAPLVVVYFFKENDENKFLNQLEKLVQHYDDNDVKFVVVPADLFFLLAVDFQVDKTPTILLISKREIIDRITNTITIEMLMERIAGILKSKGIK